VVVNGSNISTPVDCGPPPAPLNGSLESYTSTTERSVVSYSCDRGLVPEGSLMSSCTRSGWDPNPALTNCSIRQGLDPAVVGGIVGGVGGGLLVVSGVISIPICCCCWYKKKKIHDGKIELDEKA